MIDAAQVAGVLWDRVLSPRLQELLTSQGLDRGRLQLLAALHDLGKASPGFQCKAPAAYLSWPEPLSQERLRVVQDLGTSHAVVSYHAVKALLGHPDSPLPFVVGGHHGVYPTAHERAEGDPLALGKERWDEARAALSLAVEELLGSGPLTDDPCLERAFAIPVTGLVILSDWIASNVEWFPYEDSADLRAYAARARDQAEKAFEELTWRRWVPRSGRFSHHFPGFRPRPVQRALEELADRLVDPALVIVESETGSGKTESAWHLAARWVERGKASGFYLALPTRATANAMYERCERFLAGSSEGGPVLQQLVHGWASIAGEFRHRLRVGMEGIHDEGRSPGDAAVVAHAWFTYRRRGLLAPIGVGTIDQALMAALRTRFTPLRLAGLWDKVLIADEVHAYDTYMSKVLDRLIEWLSELRVPVVLLSATLSRDRKRELLEAYGGEGCTEGFDLRPYPSVAWVRWDGKGDCVAVRPSGPERRLAVELRPSREPDDVDWAVRAAERLRDAGANVLVILNTVDRAQAAAARLRHLGDRLTLLHARIPFEDRDRREREVLRRFGPGTSRCDGHVVVGTQVLEQSLDIDLDALVTDLAPIDILLQRAGRIHRHPGRRRPPIANRPRMIVGGFGLDSPAPTMPPGSLAVYSRWILLRTLEALCRTRGTVSLPGDVPGLIEAAYGAPGVPAGDRLWPEAAEEAFREHGKEVEELEALARERYVPPPTSRLLFDLITDPSVEDVDGAEADWRDRRLIALTRAGEPSVLVVLSEPGERLPGDLDDTAAARLLRRSLSLGSPRPLVGALRRRSDLRRWPRHPLLRFAYGVELDAAGEARVEGWRLRLDDLLGLVVDKGEGR